MFWRESGVDGGNAFAHGKFDQLRQIVESQFIHV